jgi:hypothetical protein
MFDTLVTIDNDHPLTTKLLEQKERGLSREAGYRAVREEARVLCLPEELDDTCGEFIAEVEELEGPEYWGAFKTVQEARDDFRMWWENRN